VFAGEIVESKTIAIFNQFRLTKRTVS